MVLAGIFEKLKPFLKFMLAIGILLGLSGFIYFSNKEANKQWKEFGETKDNDSAMSDEIWVQKYEMKEVDDTEKIHWILKAEKGLMDPKTKDINLNGIEVKYYNEGEVSMTISSPVGQANEISRKILLTSNEKGKVIGIGATKNTRLETSELKLEKKNKFIATGGVSIVWPGVAKVTSKTAEGEMSPTKFVDNLVLRGNVHTRLGM